MNARDWLADREPSPPRVLRERIEALALGVPAGQPDEPAGSLLSAAEEAMTRLARYPAGDRATAVDLLAIDALVTYALESAAEHPEAIPGFSEQAMSRLSRVMAR